MPIAKTTGTRTGIGLGILLLILLVGFIASQVMEDNRLDAAACRSIGATVADIGRSRVCVRPDGVLLRIPEMSAGSFFLGFGAGILLVVLGVGVLAFFALKSDED